MEGFWMHRNVVASIFAVILTTACAPIPALHVIGVQEGQFDQNAFNSKCADKSPGTSFDKAPPPLSPRQLSAECTAILQTKEVAVSVTDDSRPIVLALTAYNKTLWKIAVKEGVILQKVIIGGYHSQQIFGLPPDIPVEVYTYDASPCPQCWQGSEHFYSYEHPPEQLRKITGLDVTSFQGRYTGSEFFIFPKMKTLK